VSSDIIPKTISPCGAHDKKKQTQKIYNLDTIAAARLGAILKYVNPGIIFPKIFPCGALAKKKQRKNMYILHTITAVS
jgi:hypothetical protein